MAASAADLAMFDDDEPTPSRGKASAADLAMFGDDEDDERPAFLTKGAKPKPPEETRPFKNTGPDLAGQLRAEAAKAAPPPGIIDSAMAGARRAASFGFGDEIEGAVKTLTGSGPISAETYRKERDAVRARDTAIRNANPISAGIGETAAGIATSVIPGIAPARAARAGQVAMQAAKVGAVAGAGESESDLTKGDVPGFARDVGVSAGANAALAGGVSKFVRGAPERSDARMVANISRGEAGGAAKQKLSDNVVSKAGEGFENLNEVLSRHPNVKATLATSAAANPAKGAKVASKSISQLDSELTPIYSKIDNGPAVPRAVELQNKLIKLEQRLVDEGSTFEAGGVRAYMKHIATNYGDGDAVKDEVKLTGSMLRKLKQGIGQAAFDKVEDRNTPPAIAAKRMIYGVLNETVESAAAKTPGVDVSKLRELNRDSSMLIAVRDALEDRGTKAAAGRTSLFQNLLSANVLGGAVGMVTQSPGAGVGTVLGGYAALKGTQAGFQGARIADYHLAQLVRAARSGSTKAQLAQTAVELGLTRAAAEEVASQAYGAGANR